MIEKVRKSRETKIYTTSTERSLISRLILDFQIEFVGKFGILD